MPSPSIPSQPAREPIEPHWTLGRLKQTFPGVELTLFAHFGVGSRERSGFAATERLDDLLRRHLIFDAARACQRLDALASEDWENQISPEDLRRDLTSTVIIDARSEHEYQLCHIPGSQLLSAQVVNSLRSSPPTRLVVVCSDGSQSPSASRHLRGLGLPARHLQGGLVNWSIKCDESFPINYPLSETPGRWHLLADGKTLRFRRERELDTPWLVWRREEISAHPSLCVVTEALPTLEMVAVTPRSFAARGLPTHLGPAVTALRPLVDSAHWMQGGQSSDPEVEKQILARVLSEQAKHILKDHKGTVEIAGYQDRRLQLQLGGGCAGCASVEITTQRELAGALYHAVPLLDAIIAAN